MIGQKQADQLQELSLGLYRSGSDYAEPFGVILADTKFEFGMIEGRITLIDEVLTPDSSRFWPASDHQPGQEPPSWDKQILRNYLETLDWNHEAPPPSIPGHILEQTYRRYHEVLQILFPQEAEKWQAFL
jgi:phosphoribosylaminoimidazole-succinocarboxamide synthase